MKITLTWLAEFLDLGVLFEVDEAVRTGPSHPGVRQLVDAMNELGMVVEGVEHAPASLDGVVVAEVVSLEPIPGADKIRATLVNDGEGEPKSVVCGAWNFKVGDKVPWARPGVTLPTGMTLTERKMRGVVSLGMLCSPVEVGVSSEAGGLLILDPLTPPGVDFGAHFGLSDDIVFDLAIEANRPDANCVLGVARDLAAWLRIDFWSPEAPYSLEIIDDPKPSIDPEATDRLLIASLGGIETATFPLRLGRRLQLGGMRSISPVVDASNYVMLEIGQPTHPYDATSLGGGTIAARFARAGEEVVTLDGSTRALESSDIVIVDGNDQVVGLAGVMGGLATEVSDATTSVLLEAAHFPAGRIARTAKRLNARSEASARFERGTDPAILELAVTRIAELANLRIEGPIRCRIDAVRPAAPIEVRPARVGAILGHEPADELLNVLEPDGPLERIGFDIEQAGAIYRVTPPSFRPDVGSEIEVIEEIARHFGYQRITSTPLTVATTGGLTERQQLIRRLKQLLAGMGIFEAWSVTLVSPEERERTGGAGEPIELADPLVAQESELRQTLLAGLLRSLRTNVGRRLSPVALFEVGPVMQRWSVGGSMASDPSSEQNSLVQSALPNEGLRLGVLIEGAENSLVVIAPVLTAIERVFGLDGVLEVTGIDEELVGWPELHPGRRSQLRLGEKVVGVVGELHPRQIPDELIHLVEGRFGYLEMDFEALVASMHPIRRVEVPSVYTASTLDLSFAIRRDAPLEPLVDLIEEIAGELGADLGVFDRFRPTDDEEHLYVGLRLRLESDQGVITEGTVQSLIDTIDARAAALGAQLRRG
ncbi:phenylalanine--tRNA ligase subunit beta [Ferrimicrobium sp.]|uniref:phenylalanine--tRNA ligase subunit beta n=1 Tax=Ferrimicrobium sp. TaxID=2926050 RepID=UPI002612034B|nr:phenylalanine--tRNA ligase subunit beta [Ferrimicrobium sp.]